MVSLNPFRREEVFFDLLEEGIGNASDGAKALFMLVKDWDSIDVKKEADHIIDLEHKGDDIYHSIAARLHRTFVTPIDHEDIALLGNAIDDIMDFILGASQSLINYKIAHPTPQSIRLASVVVEITHEVEIAVPYIRRKKGIEGVLEYCVEINRLENEADNILHSAVADLFDNVTDAIELIKWREIYEHMESATDRCEDVANILEGVALKYA
ncbi:MAG: DUF47 domain-containing protein [Dehalococcoidia bacterium]|nr:DUF47 domain-containing protein [Dehalococcoidia bacterium]